MQGYLLASGARHLSEHTTRDYVNTLTKFSNFLDEDLPIEEITLHYSEAFFTAQTKVTNKTILNYHVRLSALWTWAVSEHIVPKYVAREVTPPKPEQKEIAGALDEIDQEQIEIYKRISPAQKFYRACPIINLAKKVSLRGGPSKPTDQTHS